MSYYRVTYSNDYLSHHGVKGMKWGVRKQNYNSKYSEEQRLRDRRVYGRGGVRRINRDMNDGYSISAARSSEAARINNTRRRAVVGGHIGRAVGAVGSYLIADKVIDSVNRATKFKYNDILRDDTARLMIKGGISAAGSYLGTYGGRSLTMLSSGYSPTKFRYA